MSTAERTTAWDQRAGVPRVVLPITRGGIVVTDRVCWLVLGAAMAAAAALILYLNRGTTFYTDELAWLYETPGLGVADVLDPHNGHLIAVTRLLYKAVLETVGAEYVAFRLAAVAALLLCVGLFYAVVKRRIGALPALAPAVVLLFLGSASQHVLIPIGFTPLLSIAFGLAALLAIERGDLGGDIAACALLVASIATYSTGLAFAVGIAILVLIGAGRWRRAWVFAVPLGLYAAWWLWALDSSASAEGQVVLSNALLIPRYCADSLAIVITGLTGLGFDFGDPSPADTLWGQVLAIVAIVALALRLRRGAIPPSLWASVGIVLTFWSLGALVTDPQRLPTDVRYVFMGSVGVLLVATDAARSTRFSRRGLVALFAVCAVALSTNVALLRDRGAKFRADSANTRAELAAVGLARDRIAPELPLGTVLPSHNFVARKPASDYFEVADRYGAVGFSPGALERQPAAVRQHADDVLAQLLGVRLEPLGGRVAAARCRKVSAGGEVGTGFELPPGGAAIQSAGDGGAVRVGRFGGVPSVEIGTLRPGEAAALRIPVDVAPNPWLVAIEGMPPIEVCPLR